MIKWIKVWIKRHIVAEFPYADACWHCNAGTCKGCSVPRAIDNGDGTGSMKGRLVGMGF